MPELLSLAELPPEVADQVMKRIRIRLRPPLPPELSWAADQPADGPPSEYADAEFADRGRGEVVQPVERPTRPSLTCEVPDVAEREGDE